MAIGDFTSDIKSIFIPVAQVQLDFDTLTIAAAEKALGGPPQKYQALPELRHTFRPEPQNPPKILTLVFLGTVSAALVGLFGAVSFLNDKMLNKTDSYTLII